MAKLHTLFLMLILLLSNPIIAMQTSDDYLETLEAEFRTYPKIHKYLKV